MHMMKCKGPRIDSWGTLCFTVPQSEKEILSLDNFI
jgi:hypothetical protein